MKYNLIQGDCLDVLKTLDSQSVNCCVTSPPYYGLRDYGVDDQIGLEQTPEEYVSKLVDVFREVKRVLRDEGTVWLNLGDSYWGSHSMGNCTPDAMGIQKHLSGCYGNAKQREWAKRDDLKPKDLIGIPWRVAFALQQPYYSGDIKNELDRLWIASMFDTEGCLFIHKREKGQASGGGYHRKIDSFLAGIEVANTHPQITDRLLELIGLGSISSQSTEKNPKRKQEIYRYHLRSNQAKQVIQEIYPYLVAKKHQARLLYACPPSGDEAAEIHMALKGLHNGVQTDMDYPPPPSLYEKGYYLRSDIIWMKPNPMPESVKDRPTKSHEYIFLLSKNSKYYYDYEAVMERQKKSSVERLERGWNGNGDRGYPGGPQNHLQNYMGKVDTDKLPKVRGYKEKDNGSNPQHHGQDIYPDKGRNKRTVWTVNTKPFKGAHFAVFPPKLITPCILAGCPKDGTVLDPFNGAGTTGMVAVKYGCNYIGIDLNPEYIEMSRERIEKANQQMSLFV